ncbi:MAG: copper amine oxidase N-terminal domain-containing protein [Oscillospiraceae bacterium]|nr:copper amine oxidase N-terminal domain-containing protein [Oscillospiraceae bacterium]
MKKGKVKSFIAGFLVCAVLTTAVVTFAATGVMREVFLNVHFVTVNNNRVNFDYDARPFTMNNRTYLPIRAIAEALNLSIVWEHGSIYIAERNLDTSQLLGAWTINDGGMMQHFAVTLYFRADGTGEQRNIVNIFIEEPPFEIHSEDFEWSVENGQLAWGSEETSFVTYDYQLFEDTLRMRFPSPSSYGMFRSLERVSPESPLKTLIPELFYGLNFAVYPAN